MDIEQLLKKAIENVSSNYFQLPIGGREDSIYRERVYCYELYHQLRLLWPDDTNYELSGEVDKSGHPLIRGNKLDRIKPDLLVHIPGDMGGNYTIIEVKPIVAKSDGIKKDLETLTAFRQYARYQKAFYLFYGDGNIEDIIDIAKNLSQDEESKIDLLLINFWHHKSVGMQAIKVPFDI